MGAGSTTLLWYAVCFVFVCFIAIVATGLIIYGQSAEARKQRAREAARERSQKIPEEPPALDPDDPDR